LKSDFAPEGGCLERSGSGAGIIPFRLDERGLHFLVLRASTHGTWGFPKGYLDPGEEEEEAARREFREETGLPGFRTHPGFHAFVSYTVDSRGMLRQKTVSYSLGEAYEGPVLLSPEHDAYAWLEPPGVMERIPFENLRKVFASAVIHLWRSLGPRARPLRAREPLPIPEARSLLFSLGSTGDRWVRHSVRVGEASNSIAESVVEAGGLDDASFTAGAGLLHDLGRALDHDRHGWEGYRLLGELGLPGYARVSLTHWLKGRDASQLIEDGLRGEDLVQVLEWAHRFRPLRLEEKIVCVADALVAGDRVVPIEERFRFARERYGDTAWMRRNETLSLAWQGELEVWIGRPLLGVVRK